MKALEDQWDETNDMVGNLLDIVGKPANGPTPASGLHHLVSTLSERMSAYDKIRERALGAASVALPGAAAFGTLVWFAWGDVITKVFKG